MINADKSKRYCFGDGAGGRLVLEYLLLLLKETNSLL